MTNDTYCTPAEIRYLDYCTYMARVYGAYWAEGIRRGEIRPDKRHMAELRRRLQAATDSKKGKP